MAITPGRTPKAKHPCAMQVHNKNNLNLYFECPLLEYCQLSFSNVTSYTHWICFQVAFLWIEYINIQFPTGPRNPTAAQHGAKDQEKRERENKPTNRARGTTRQRPTKKTKRSDNEEKEAGANRADGEANTRVDTPQREEPTHEPSAISKHAPSKTAEEREDREERKGYKITPSESTAARNTEGPRERVPNQPERANHAGTI